MFRGNNVSLARTCGVSPDVFLLNVYKHSMCKVGQLRLAVSWLGNRVASVDTVTSYNVQHWFEVYALCQHGLADEAYEFCKVVNVARAKPLEHHYRSYVERILNGGSTVYIKTVP